jgi:plastocyanin
MKRLHAIIAAVALVSVVAAAASAAPSSSTIVIRHQVRGCHTWSVNGGPYKAAQSTTIARNGTMTIIDNDVMPHKLIQKSGPGARFVGRPAMNHMGASVKVVFSKPGVYRFTTKPGEDYMNMPMMKTIGEDNVLRLTVTVS